MGRGSSKGLIWCANVSPNHRPLTSTKRRTNINARPFIVASNSTSTTTNWTRSHRATGYDDDQTNDRRTCDSRTTVLRLWQTVVKVVSYNIGAMTNFWVGQTCDAVQKKAVLFIADVHVETAQSKIQFKTMLSTEVVSQIVVALYSHNNQRWSGLHDNSEDDWCK